MTNQIIVQLNPDVPPTGSDLGIVNAARKSFGRRSEWDYFKSNGDLLSGTEASWFNKEDKESHFTKKLKDKDKRLLEFLARGMTADDFEAFCDRNFWWNFLSDDPEDEGLRSYAIDALWEWRNTPTHDTPFNHGFFSFEVKAPVFVARHLVKHEYLIMSEYSRRYITDDVEFYTPDVWRKAAADVKQGSSDDQVYMLGLEGSSSIQIRPLPYKMTGGGSIDEHTKDLNKVAIELYKEMISSGVAPEQARMVLPQSLMTSWTWSGTLGAFANMCKLRLSKDTQYETRLVAQGVYAELKKQFPVAAPLLVEGVL